MEDVPANALTDSPPPLSGEALLARALSSGVPVVAVLGQEAGWSTGSPDPVLGVALAKAARVGNDWKALLTREPLPPAFYEWVAERFARRAPAADLLSVADLPLSAVFTSSIDPGVLNLLTTTGREPEPVLLGDPAPPVARSKRRPPVYYLFGRAGIGSAELQPPETLQALAQRRLRHAAAMLRAVNEAATAVGLIVIDGYRPNGDWLRAEDLLAILGTAAKGSVLWCGAEPELQEDDRDTYQGLRDDGVILRDPRSFGTLAALLRVQGYQASSQHWDDPEIVSLADGKRLITDARLRLATQASATIIDDSLVGFLPPQSGSVEESAFRNFHAIPTGIRARIEGIRRGFAIVRQFEEELTERVTRALSQHHLEPGAVILHGQSGVGKSVALARLACVIKERGTAAVLFASERMVQPIDISDFLAEVDRIGAVTLVIVDVTLAPVRFDELLSALRSRGHRVVVVGASYRVEAAGAAGGSGRMVLAPAELSAAEQSALSRLAARFAPGSRVSADQAFALARFYWDLPGSRERLSHGLSREARATEAQLRLRGTARRPLPVLGEIGEALVLAGYAAPTVPVLNDGESGSAEDNSAAGRVIDYVMVAARLYKSVPVNLILRAVVDKALASERGVGIDVVRDLFLEQDLFRWRFGDEEGEELLVGARLQLEAELICNRRLGGPHGETLRAQELIQSCYRAGPEGHEETKFLTELVYALGPDGPFGDRYKDGYADIARELTSLRERRGARNARLMLQESNLRRAYIRTHDVPREEKAALLDEATRAVDDALQAIDQTATKRLYASQRTRDHLWVERAATYGFLATDSAQRGDTREQIWRSYRAARDAIRTASLRVDTYFPLDIALWLPLQILREAPSLGDLQRAELEADFRSSLDAVDPANLPPYQFERFQRHRLNLGELVKDVPLSDAAFRELESAGSSAGYYLRARRLAPNRPDNGERADRNEQAAAVAARDYLRKHYDRIVSDARCLTLLLGCEWVAATGRWLFRGSRQPLPHNRDVQTRCRAILLDLFTATPDKAQPRYRYLENVLNWLTNDEMRALERWRELARDTEYIEQSRVINRHTLTDEAGKPRVFSGIVERQLGSDRWSVLVGEIDRRVDLVESRFDGAEIAIGQSVRHFAISFNYLGPIADFFAVRSARS